VDGRRFDSWTRALAGGGSRRRLLRGLAGGVGAWFVTAWAHRDGAAHHTTAYAGDPCRKDSDCVAADTQLFCADNGMGHDGQLNCCSYAQGRCAGDDTCCGQLVCYQSTCVDPSQAAPPPVTPPCTSENCPCTPNTPNPCDQGLVCCGGADPTQGTCIPLYTCTGYGLPGQTCPAYCLPGPTQCGSCVSGYCTVDGVCG
jgi:hypothetical protein